MPEGDVMFDVLCSGCDKRQLLTAGRILGLRNTPDGVIVAYQCWCGAQGSWSAREPARHHAELPLAG